MTSVTEEMIEAAWHKLEPLDFTRDDLRAALEAALSASPAAQTEVVGCETCQGNGEIVTDWDRYLKAHPGDTGDEAVATCPACDGTGHAAPSAPQPTEPVAVKPLQWRQLTSPREDGPPEPIAEWEADCVIGTYFIKEDGGEWWLHLADLFDTQQVGRSDDPDRLRVVAQADYTARILSALASPVAQQRDEVIEECARVAADWLNEWAADLYATFESYVEAQSTGKHNGRRIEAGNAKMFAGQFRERAEAVAGCVDGLTAAIRALSPERKDQSNGDAK